MIYFYSKIKEDFWKGTFISIIGTCFVQTVVKPLNHFISGSQIINGECRLISHIQHHEIPPTLPPPTEKKTKLVIQPSFSWERMFNSEFLESGFNSCSIHLQVRNWICSCTALLRYIKKNREKNSGTSICIDCNFYCG